MRLIELSLIVSFHHLKDLLILELIHFKRDLKDFEYKFEKYKIPNISERKI